MQLAPVFALWSCEIWKWKIKDTWNREKTMWNEIGKNKTNERSATIGNVSCNKGFLVRQTIDRELNIGKNECGEIYKTITCGKSKKTNLDLKNSPPMTLPLFERANYIVLSVAVTRSLYWAGTEGIQPIHACSSQNYLITFVRPSK